ncbi:MAG TPA: hypothetical protein VN420_00115 [Candidatus Fimivivens sp.]|nr:hypothetical protein [Candidatus Fimivivens sp.]
MKSMVIIYDSDDWENDTPLSGSPETRASFEEFYLFAATKGWTVYRASTKWFDRTRFLFSKGWTFSESGWEKVRTPIVPDAIFDKVAGRRDYSLFEMKMEISGRIPVINSPLFRTVFDNKLSQYLAFREFMPTSFLAENTAQFARALKEIPSEKVVAKEIYGSGGKEVAIEPKSVFENELSLSFPVLVQEFVPTGGIPDFSEKGEVADLRLVYIGDSLVYALSRVAEPGSLFTNFHRGATAKIVPSEKIPDDCITMAEQIRKKTGLFDRTNYSLDFMFDLDGKPFFIEMNTTPGFDLLRLIGTKELKEHYFDLFLALFE